MVAPNDIFNRIDEIENLIASNNNDRAVKKLMDYTRDFSEERRYYRAAIMLSANWKQLDSEGIKGTIDSKEHIQRRNELMDKMLSLIDVVKNEIGDKESLAA